MKETPDIKGITINEFIKVLEYCASHDDLLACKGCIFDEKCNYDHCYTEKLALDILKRQQVDNEDLYAVADKFKKENERLSELAEVSVTCFKGIDRLYKIKCKELEAAKSEAIKEFEKLVQRRLNSNTPRGAYLMNIIADVKKEMTNDLKE